MLNAVAMGRITILQQSPKARNLFSGPAQLRLARSHSVEQSAVSTA